VGHPEGAAQRTAVDEPSTERREAVHLGRGSVANRQIVAIGRDLWIEGQALQNAAVLQGNALIEGSVEGDVIALGGDIHLTATARVGGDVYALGGQVELAPGALVRGQTAAFPDAPATFLVLMEGPALGLAAWSKPLLAAKFAVVFAWLLVAMVVLAMGGEESLRRTGETLRRQPLHAFFVGLVALSSILVGLVLFSAFAPPAVGLPTAAIALLLMVLAKVWGTIAAFEIVGGAAGRALGRPLAAPSRLTLGACSIAWIKFVPYVGTVVWSALTLIAIGASLSTRFGAQRGPSLD
jgi:hypothetical protein